MKNSLNLIAKVFKAIGVLFLISAIGLGIFYQSYYLGFSDGYSRSQVEFEKLLAENEIHISSLTDNVENQTEVIKEYVYVTPPPRTWPSWTGPELFEAVNNRRVELGVNPLANETNLCTIASLRLNQLLELGKLDAHEGFIELSKRDDYDYIFDKYNVYEFLLSGADSPQEAVSLWENTQGHSKLLTGGEYVWGCTYAQAGFGVAIAAF